MKTKMDTGFALRLKTLREAAGMTQQELADKVGMNRFGVAKLEQGVTEPYWPTVLKIAEALGVPCMSFQADKSADHPMIPLPATPKKPVRSATAKPVVEDEVGPPAAKPKKPKNPVPDDEIGPPTKKPVPVGDLAGVKRKLGKG